MSYSGNPGVNWRILQGWMGYLTGVHTENAVQGVQKVLFDQLTNSKYEGLGTPSDHPLWSRRTPNTYISYILPLVTLTPPTHCTVYQPYR